jgi:hypothetical protein
MTREQRDELRRLERKAVPAPWHAEPCTGDDVITAKLHTADTRERIIYDSWVALETDAFVVAMRNALPSLLDALDAAESSLASAREEARGLREALNGATAVWFGTQLYPAFSGEKNRRMDAAMERARAVLSPSPAPEAGPPTTCGGCAYFAPWENGIDGDCRPNGINTGHVYATEEACAEPGPRAPAPAASADTREEGSR